MESYLTLSLAIIVIILLNDVNSFNNNGKYHYQNFSYVYKHLIRKHQTSMVATSEPKSSTSSSFLHGKNDHIYGKGALYNNKNQFFTIKSIYGGLENIPSTSTSSSATSEQYIDASLQTPVIVGIAGGSGSGKTTLTQAIIKSLGQEFVTYIQHDSYYKDLSHMTLEERAHNNFDHPSSLDTDLLRDHLLQLKLGKAVKVPEYCYKTHSRLDTFVETNPRRIIIVDGILLFHDSELCNLMDMKIFVDAEDDVRLIRRIKRDTSERARSVESIIDQYSTTVKPMHYLFVEPSKKNADIIIPSNQGIQAVALEMCLSRLREIINYYQ